MNQRKVFRPELYVIALVWLTALAFASVYDLDISLAIADPNSVFGRTLEIIGEPPAILFTSFNFSLMMAHFLKRRDRRTLHLTLAALTFVGTVGTAVFTAIQTADYIADWRAEPQNSLATVIAIFIALVIAGFFMLSSLRLDEAALSRYFDTACHCAYAAIATFVIIWLIKLGWGRVRFRQLDGDLTRFTAWYLPQGFTGYFSFPSGHTANATVILTATYYLRFLPNKHQSLKPLIYAALILWIVLLAYSRVRVGAHYLSDVLFGAAITFGIVNFFKPRNHDKH